MTKGERIKQARLEKGYTLEELAEKCDTTRQAINKYEKGTVTNIPSDKIELLSKALDVSPAYIMGWETNDHIISIDMDILIEAIRKPLTNMSEEGFNRLVQYANELERIYPKKEKKIVTVYNPDKEEN